jgi:enoyl-CoA hydratase/carnithine racemase
MSATKYVFSNREENVFLITIDHPPLNTLNLQTLSELESALDEFAADSTLKVAILTGGDKPVFVSGADLGEVGELFADGRLTDLIFRGQSLFPRIADCSKPIVAAINGLALGGGMELAMACHLRVMSDRAKLAQPEINLGVIPGWGGTQRLSRIVGLAKAREMILTGERISAQEALRLNLVNMVVPRREVLPASRALARKIAAKSGLVIRAAMDSVRMSTQMSMTDGLAFEAGQIAKLINSADAREGLMAFLEKRQPVFKDE